MLYGSVMTYNLLKLFKLTYHYKVYIALVIEHIMFHNKGGSYLESSILEFIPNTQYRLNYEFLLRSARRFGQELDATSRGPNWLSLGDQWPAVDYG